MRIRSSYLLLSSLLVASAANAQNRTEATDATAPTAQKKEKEGEKKVEESAKKKKDEKELKGLSEDASEAFAGKVIELDLLKEEPSVSRKFLKIFDKSVDKISLEEKREEAVVVSAHGITVTKPIGWAQIDLPESEKNELVLAFQEAGNPTNRIEVRRGFNIDPSRREQYLDSFRTNLENAGFETTLDDLDQSLPVAGETSENQVDSAGSAVPFRKRSVGGLRGEYLRYRVANVDVTSPLRGQTKTGLLIFLYEGRHAPWIFAAFSTSGDIGAIQPLFEDLLRSAQFQLKSTTP